MRLRIVGRHDTLLLSGLAFALLLVFGQTIKYGLDVARDIERTYGVELLPALLILSLMFVFHQYANRRETQAEAEAASIAARLAQRRAAELEQLMLFGQALAGALHIDGLREAIWRHLPALTSGPATWVLLRNESGWDRLVDVSCTRWPAGELEEIADEAAARQPAAQERTDGFEHQGHLCFVLHVGRNPVGVMGLPIESATRETRDSMAAAAALLTIAVRNAQLFADVRDHSVKDALTGCYNRAHGIEMLDAELARSRRARTPLSVVMFDVDQFKSINDRYGHPCGDAVLMAVGQRMRHALRRSDVRCRYGGDEFLVVLPETPSPGAMKVAELLRTEMEQVVVPLGTDHVTVTISVGVTTVAAGGLSATAVVNRADQALYQAKGEGRNCIRLASDERIDDVLDTREPVVTTH